MTPKHSLLTFILAGLLALGMLAGSSVHANAANRVLKYPTTLTFTQLPSINLGKPYTLSGYIKSNVGAAVPFLDILFTVDGIKVGQTRTNQTGYFQHTFANKFNAGTYTVIGTTKTNQYFLGTTGSTSLQILPADVRVQSVPPIPGLPFNMAGETFFAGPDGVADVKISDPGKYN